MHKQIIRLIIETEIKTLHLKLEHLLVFSFIWIAFLLRIFAPLFIFSAFSINIYFLTYIYFTIINIIV